MDYAKLRDNFNVPAGKIDFISLGIPNLDDKEIDRKLAECLRGLDESFKAPKKISKCYFTIHDPKTTELQKFIDAFPDLQVYELEISLDFYLKDKTNDIIRLEELRCWFAKTLYPQKHARFKDRSWRKYYDVSSGSVIRDRMLTKGQKTIYWYTGNGNDKIRLYIKQLDNKKPIDIHCVRLEVTLGLGGCQNAGVNRLFMLPKFVNEMRKTLSPYFSVAKYIKPTSKRATRSKDPDEIAKIKKANTKEEIKFRKRWERYGVSWALKHHFAVQPDSEVNRFIGQGLKKLRENLSKLIWTEYKAEIVAKWDDMYLVKT